MPSGIEWPRFFGCGDVSMIGILFFVNVTFSLTTRAGNEPAIFDTTSVVAATIVITKLFWDVIKKMFLRLDLSRKIPKFAMAYIASL